jgi:hypothetical protein
MKKTIIIMIALALGGCDKDKPGISLRIVAPVDNATIILPSSTRVVIGGVSLNTVYSITVDGTDFGSQIVSSGHGVYEGNISLPAGLHTLTVSALSVCAHCPGGVGQVTQSTSFIVTNSRSCARVVGGPPIFTIPSSFFARSPGQKIIIFNLPGGGAIVIIVDDAPGLLPTQMEVEIDIDPASGVTRNKEIEAWGFCKSGPRVGVVEASMLSPIIDVARFCNPARGTNNFRSGCTRTQTMLIDQFTTWELWLRKPGFLGIWSDVQGFDESIWQAFGGRHVRVLWMLEQGSVTE